MNVIPETCHVDFECTWWMLFQKRVMHTKFDIYIFIAETDASWEIW